MRMRLKHVYTNIYFNVLVSVIKVTAEILLNPGWWRLWCLSQAPPQPGSVLHLTSNAVFSFDIYLRTYLIEWSTKLTLVFFNNVEMRKERERERMVWCDFGPCCDQCSGQSRLLCAEMLISFLPLHAGLLTCVNSSWHFTHMLASTLFNHFW